MSRIGDVLDLNNEFSAANVLNVALEMDSRYYLNITQIKYSNIPEFSSSYDRIVERFASILDILQRSNGHDELFNQALRLLPQGDLNEISLGYSNGAFGKGIGYKTRRLIIERAKAIIDRGITDPTFFFFTPLFTSGVGADRLSDLIGNIIISDIRNYSRRIMDTLNINHETYPLQLFSEGYLLHPKYSRKKLLFVPESIIHRLPIDQEYLYVDDFYNSNQTVRNEVNNAVGEAWKSMTNKAKKDVLFEVFKSSSFTSSLIEDFRNLPDAPYDFTQDSIGDIYLQSELPGFLRAHVVEFNTDSIGIENKISYLVDTFRIYISQHNLKSLIHYADNKNRGIGFTLRLFQLVSEYISLNSALGLTFRITDNAGIIRINDDADSFDLVFRYLSNRSIKRVLKGCSAVNYEKGRKNNLKYIVIVDETNEYKLQALRDEYSNIQTHNQFTPDLVEIDIR